MGLEEFGFWLGLAEFCLFENYSKVNHHSSLTWDDTRNRQVKWQVIWIGIDLRLFRNNLTWLHLWFSQNDCDLTSLKETSTCPFLDDAIVISLPHQKKLLQGDSTHPINVTTNARLWLPLERTSSNWFLPSLFVKQWKKNGAPTPLRIRRSTSMVSI